MNSERPPPRQNRLKVQAVRLFITRLGKPPLSAAHSAHGRVWAPVFGFILCGVGGGGGGEGRDGTTAAAFVT